MDFSLLHRILCGLNPQGCAVRWSAWVGCPGPARRLPLHQEPHPSFLLFPWSHACLHMNLRLKTASPQGLSTFQPAGGWGGGGGLREGAGSGGGPAEAAGTLLLLLVGPASSRAAPAAGEGCVQPDGRWVGWRVTRGDSPGSRQAGHMCTFNMAPLLFKAFQYPPNKPIHFKAYTCFYVNM